MFAPGPVFGSSATVFSTTLGVGHSILVLIVLPKVLSILQSYDVGLLFPEAIAGRVFLI